MEGMGAASHFVCGLHDARLSKAELEERRGSQVTIGCNVKVSTSLVASVTGTVFQHPTSNIAFAFFFVGIVQLLRICLLFPGWHSLSRVGLLLALVLLARVMTACICGSGMDNADSHGTPTNHR